MTGHNLEGGFTDQPIDSAHMFRALLQAMANPGTIKEVGGASPPAPMSQAAGAAILTLCDPETAVFLGSSHDLPQIRDWIGFHTGARLTNAREANFAIGLWEELPLDQFHIGSPEYPDRSATLIVERESLSNDAEDDMILRGPGIEDTARLSLPECGAFISNARAFPLGLDFIFTAGNRLAALPRTTKIEPAQAAAEVI